MADCQFRRAQELPAVTAPVTTVRNGAAQIDMLEFGWRTGRGRQLMARSETVDEKSLFKNAFHHQRCLILAHGFYDSQDMGKYMQPWHFQLKGEEDIPVVCTSFASCCIPLQMLAFQPLLRTCRLRSVASNRADLPVFGAPLYKPGV
jgi:hypothetical protein